MNRFAAGIRIVLIAIGLFGSVAAIADTQCLGGTPPPCSDPIEVTGERDPIPTCEELGTCTASDPILVASGMAVAASTSQSKSFIEKHIKKVALFCLRASTDPSVDPCTKWGEDMAATVCGRGSYVVLGTICNIAVVDEVQVGCRDVPKCPLG